MPHLSSSSGKGLRNWLILTTLLKTFPVQYVLNIPRLCGAAAYPLSVFTLESTRWSRNLAVLQAPGLLPPTLKFIHPEQGYRTEGGITHCTNALSQPLNAHSYTCVEAVVTFEHLLTICQPINLSAVHHGILYGLVWIFVFIALLPFLYLSDTRHLISCIYSLLHADATGQLSREQRANFNQTYGSGC